MARCEACGNDYDKAFLVTMNGKAQLLRARGSRGSHLSVSVTPCGCIVVGST